jgi:hypothetical protein
VSLAKAAGDAVELNVLTPANMSQLIAFKHGQSACLYAPIRRFGPSSTIQSSRA